MDTQELVLKVERIQKQLDDLQTRFERVEQEVAEQALNDCRDHL